MKQFSRMSFQLRLILGAVLWISLALVVSGAALEELFRVHVTRQFEDELHAHTEELSGLVTVDRAGSIQLSQRLSDPRFLPPQSGFYWTAQCIGGQSLGSPSLAGKTLSLDASAPRDGKDYIRQAPTEFGPVRVVQRSIRKPGCSGDLLIGVGTAQAQLDEVLTHFNTEFFIALFAIGIGLIAAATAQVSFGLQPLRKLQRDLKSIRSGAATVIDEDVPPEIRPLVTDLNDLLQGNRVMLERARLQAGNLAHALKTPLAIIVDEARVLIEKGMIESGATISDQAGTMQRNIDFQLARARAGSQSNTPVAVSNANEVFSRTVTALERLYADRGIRFQLTTPSAPLLVACDPQDLSEIAGNLLDNAGKWARTTVSVLLQARPGNVAQISIEDDGPGVPPEAIDEVFGIGVRLDGSKPGSGLGLAIVQDIIELYGGAVSLGQSPAGGVRAIIDLPRPAGI